MFNVVLSLCSVMFVVEGFAAGVVEVEKPMSGLSLAFAKLALQKPTENSGEIVSRAEMQPKTTEHEFFLEQLTFSNLLINLGFSSNDSFYKMHEHKLSEIKIDERNGFLRLYKKEYLSLVSQLTQGDVSPPSSMTISPVEDRQRKSSEDRTFFACSGTRAGIFAWSKELTSEYSLKREALDNAFWKWKK